MQVLTPTYRLQNHLQQHPATFSGVTAFVDYNRLRAEVESVTNGHFNLPLLRRLLSTLNVSATTFYASETDDRLMLTASRLGFYGICGDPYSPRCGSDWMSQSLLCEVARAQENARRDLVLVGATADDVEAIRALRATSASVIAVNWPRAFDLELVWMANRCVRLTGDFIIDPTDLSRCLLEQAR